MVFYPRGAQDCFTVRAALRPRLVSWLARHLEPHRGVAPRRRAWDGGAFDPSWSAAEAVDPDFAAALGGEEPKREWHPAVESGMPGRWGRPGDRAATQRIAG